jgi:hypothetical protein
MMPIDFCASLLPWLKAIMPAESNCSRRDWACTTFGRAPYSTGTAIKKATARARTMRVSSVLAASAVGVERFSRVGGVLVAQTAPLTPTSGRLLDLGGGRVVVLDGTTLVATDAEGPADRVAVADGALALAAGDLNGDATADLDIHVRGQGSGIVEGHGEMDDTGG